MSDTGTKYPFLDLAKNILSLFILAIHIGTLSPVGSRLGHLFINGIARIAVPFFFCCTGFLMAEKGVHIRETVVKYIKKILQLYIMMTAAYLPMILGEIIYKHHTGTFNFLGFIHKLIVEGSYLHLWYLPASALAVWILHIFVCKFNTKLITVIGCVLYIFGVLGDGYYGIIGFMPKLVRDTMSVIELVFLTTRNALFFGFPFIILGFLAFKNKNMIYNTTVKAIFLISLFLLLVESELLRFYGFAKDYNLMLMLVPTTYFGFLSLLSLPQPSFNSIIFNRRFSSFVYCYHIWGIAVLIACREVFKINLLYHTGVQFFIVTSMLTTIFLCKLKIYNYKRLPT